jgi:hypothetical protein
MQDDPSPDPVDVLHLSNSAVYETTEAEALILKPSVESASRCILVRNYGNSL